MQFTDVSCVKTNYCCWDESDASLCGDDYRVADVKRLRRSVYKVLKVLYPQIQDFPKNSCL